MFKTIVATLLIVGLTTPAIAEETAPASPAMKDLEQRLEAARRCAVSTKLAAFRTEKTDKTAAYALLDESDIWKGEIQVLAAKLGQDVLPHVRNESMDWVKAVLDDRDKEEALRKEVEDCAAAAPGRTFKSL